VQNFSIGVIAGDGIGPEVINEGVKLLNEIQESNSDIVFDMEFYDWGCEYYLEHGVMMPDDGIETLKKHDAILFGAVGAKEVPDHISVWELILPIRRSFEQYVNLRPIKLLKGVKSPLAGRSPQDIDFVVVRENTEGEYSNSGGLLHSGTPYELAIQNSVFTRYGTERILKYAFNLANESEGKKRLTVATKSNAINFAMPFWDEVAKEISIDFSDVETDYYHIDALAAYFVMKPDYFDVVVGSNLFGDILTDLGAAIVGGLGLAPSANINPERKYPSMFEPIHGSAPDIAGKGIANPIATLWSVGMMLEFLDIPYMKENIVDAIESVIEEGKVLTPDLGGESSTSELGDRIISKFKEIIKLN